MNYVRKNDFSFEKKLKLSQHNMNTLPPALQLKRTLNIQEIQESISELARQNLKTMVYKQTIKNNSIITWTVTKIKRYYLLTCTEINTITNECSATSDLVDKNGNFIH